MFCIYPNPPAADFAVVLAAFESGLPSLLNHFFPLAGRIATSPSSGLPEVRCCNQGVELVVGEAGVALAAFDYANMTESLGRIQLPYGADVALSVQVVSFACGGFTVAWSTNHLLVFGCALSSLVSAWSELALSGALSRGSQPNHRRAVFRPRTAPSYSAALDEAVTPLRADRQVNVLTFEQAAVERLYYIEASDVERLRQAASRNGRRATRVQAVSANLWKTLAGVVSERMVGRRVPCRQRHHLRGPRGARGGGCPGAAGGRGGHGERGDHGAGVRRALPGAGGLGGGAQGRAVRRDGEPRAGQPRDDRVVVRLVPDRHGLRLRPRRNSDTDGHVGGEAVRRVHADRGTTRG